MKSKPHPQADHTGGIIALISVAFVFATFGVFGRFLDGNFSLYQQLYLRIFAAAVIAYIVFYQDLHIKKILALPKREWGILFLRSLLFYGLGSLFYLQAMLTTSYSNATFLTAIPTVAVLGIIFMQEKLTWQKLVVIFFALIGVFLISVADFSKAFVWGRGEILALIADVFFSLGFISRKWHGDHLNNKEISWLILCLGFVITGVLSFVIDRSLPITGWTPSYAGMIILAGGFSVASQLLSNYGFQHVKPFLANNIISLETMYALLIGLFLYAEIPTVRELLGGLIILLSVPLMNKLEEEEKEKA